MRRVFAALVLLSVPDGLVSTLASPFLRSLGYPLAEIGVLVSAYAIASLVARLPAGRLADGRHARVAFAIACAAYALALALYPVAIEPWAFWAVRALHGLAIGTATTLNFAAFLSTARGQNRSRATSLYMAAMAAGYGTGNVISGLLADHFGFGVAFLVGATSPLLALAVAPPVTPIAPVATTAALASLGRWGLLRRPDIWVVPALGFSERFIHNVLNTLFPLYVLAIGQTLSLAGTARGIQSFTNVVTRPFGDTLVRRLGSVGLAVLGLSLTGAAVASLPLITAPLLLIAIFVVIGVGRSCSVVSNALITVDLSEGGVVKRGTASALATTGQDVGALLGPIVAGAVAGQVGIGPALQVLAIGTSLLGILAMLSARRSLAAARPRVTASVPRPSSESAA